MRGTKSAFIFHLLPTKSIDHGEFIRLLAEFHVGVRFDKLMTDNIPLVGYFLVDELPGWAYNNFMTEKFKIEKYSKKLEQADFQTSQKEVAESLNRLSQPLSEIDYKKDTKAEIKTDQCEMSFSFSPAEDPSLIRLTSGFLEQYKDDERLNNYEKVSDIKNWNELKEFTFKLEKGEQINLFEKMPENCKVYFYDNEALINAAYFHKRDRAKGDNIIIFVGKLDSLASISILLHEVGHAWDHKRLDGLGEKIGLIESGAESDFLERVRKERAATAFEFKILRPLLKHESVLKKDIINSAKDYAINGYCQNAKFLIDRHYSMAKSMQDVWTDSDDEDLKERHIEDIFMDWKKTDEYKKWRELDEFKEIEDEWMNEYGVWREWVKRQGKSPYDFEIVED